MTHPVAPPRAHRAVALLLCLLGASMATRHVTAAGPPADVDLIWGARIPMRDGVRLNATIYKPRGAGPLPVIFTLTPYIADSYHARAIYFARHGYVFALVDVRGRGSSEGRFNPMAQEARDGHDTVEWLAAQSWCDGKVGMWGGSYAGYDQWATAKELPPHLATIVPAAAAFPGVDFPFFKNIFYPYDIQWLTFTSGATGNANLFGDQSFWIQKYRELYLSHRPFKDLPEIVGNRADRFAEWLEHPMQDTFWDAMTPTDEQFARINLPILTITGHYDDDQAGALEHYKRHMRLAPEAARARHFLIIGPWDHAGTRTPTREVGGLTFGEASMLDLNDLHRQWYDWTMKAGPRPAFLESPVAWYVVGPEKWRHAVSLESVTDARIQLYLDSTGGRAGDVFASGALSERAPSAKSQPDRFIYDPLDTRPAEMETGEIKNPLTDQRAVTNLYGNGAVYHSEPFDEAAEVSGSVRLALWIQLDVSDTDIAAALYELLPEGGSVLLAGDQIRARYRESLRSEELVMPGTINRYEFTAFNFFSRRIAKGSRLRLVVRCPNSIFTQKNYNSGGVVARESGQDARTAHVAIYHDAKHPSVLELPLGHPEPGAVNR